MVVHTDAERFLMKRFLLAHAALFFDIGVEEDGYVERSVEQRGAVQLASLTFESGCRKSKDGVDWTKDGR